MKSISDFITVSMRRNVCKVVTSFIGVSGTHIACVLKRNVRFRQERCAVLSIRTTVVVIEQSKTADDVHCQVMTPANDDYRMLMVINLSVDSSTKY